MSSAVLLCGAVALRVALAELGWAEPLPGRADVESALHSLGGVKEAQAHRFLGLSPYAGSLVHAPPAVIWALGPLVDLRPGLHVLPFALADAVSAVCLGRLCRIAQRRAAAQEGASKGAGAQLPVAWATPRMCQLLYLANPCTLGACLGNNWSSLEECCVMIAILCAANRSSWAAAAALAVAAHMSLHQIYMIVPLAVLVSEERRFVSAALVFGIQVAMLCSLVVYLSALLAVHLEATVPQWLDSTYGFMLRADDLTPSMGLWWYFFAEIFDHFRAFFLFVFHVQPALLLLPLTMRTRHTPLSLVLTTCLLITLFKPFPCAADLALCCSLVPLALYELRQLPSLFVVGCALAVAFTMHPVLLDLWVERYTGNANFVLATTIVHALALTTLVVDVASVSTSRGGARHKKTL